MRFKIRKCAQCGKYTLQEKHCGTAAKLAHPAKWSPVDKWARYRRIAKKIETEKVDANA